jgi:NDP-sugar pyrophosphorylase family protein
MMHPVNGMLLAAGRGERMEPLSSVIPKPALEVLGRPLLASALAQLRGVGCERVVVNLHRHPEIVAAAARDADGELRTSWEPELLGGAGGLCAARPLLANSAVLVGNADVWSDLDLAPLLAAGDDGTAVLALLPHPDPVRWSSVVLEDGDRVKAFLPPGATHGGERYLFTGFQLIGAEVMASLPAPPAEMPAVWQGLLQRGALRGVVVRGGWHEVGEPGAYRELVTWLLGEDSWVHPQTTVAEGARIVRSTVGAGCRVGADAGVYESVLTAGAAVEDACELQRCVLAGPVTVSGASTVANTLILPHGRFPLR